MIEIKIIVKVLESRTAVPTRYIGLLSVNVRVVY